MALRAAPHLAFRPQAQLAQFDDLRVRLGYATSRQDRCAACYSDLNFLSPELVQHIEYKKGTYFADEGDFTSAGAARFRLADRVPAGLVSLSLGSYG
jgi:hypothetical protein